MTARETGAAIGTVVGFFVPPPGHAMFYAAAAGGLCDPVIGEFAEQAAGEPA